MIYDLSLLCSHADLSFTRWVFSLAPKIELLRGWVHIHVEEDGALMCFVGMLDSQVIAIICQRKKNTPSWERRVRRKLETFRVPHRLALRVQWFCLYKLRWVIFSWAKTHQRSNLRFSLPQTPQRRASISKKQQHERNRRTFAEEMSAITQD